MCGSRRRNAAFVYSVATPVGAVSVHASGNQVASGAADGQISLWKLDVPAPRPLAPAVSDCNCQMDAF